MAQTIDLALVQWRVSCYNNPAELGLFHDVEMKAQWWREYPLEVGQVTILRVQSLPQDLPGRFLGPTQAGRSLSRSSVQMARLASRQFQKTPAPR